MKTSIFVIKTRIMMVQLTVYWSGLGKMFRWISLSVSYLPATWFAYNSCSNTAVLPTAHWPQTTTLQLLPMMITLTICFRKIHTPILRKIRWTLNMASVGQSITALIRPFVVYSYHSGTKNYRRLLRKKNKKWKGKNLPWVMLGNVTLATYSLALT